MSARAWKWSVSYETATIARGTAETREAAEHAAVIAETTEVLRGLNPDSLARHVSEARA